jgi:hypothetical protein
MISKRIASDLRLYSTGGGTRIGIGGAVSVSTATLDAIRVGDADVKNMRVSIHDAPFNAFEEGLWEWTFWPLQMSRTSRSGFDLSRRRKVLGPRDDRQLSIPAMENISRLSEPLRYGVIRGSQRWLSPKTRHSPLASVPDARTSRSGCHQEGFFDEFRVDVQQSFARTRWRCRRWSASRFTWHGLGDAMQARRRQWIWRVSPASQR